VPISQIAGGCWVLGAVNDAEWVPHFISDASVREWARANEPESLATIRQLAEPCWTAVCDGPGVGPSDVCGVEFEDGEGGNHGPSRTVTEDWIAAHGWLVLRDGTVFGLCCEDDWPPANPPATVSPGQLTLDDQDVADA